MEISDAISGPESPESAPVEESGLRFCWRRMGSHQQRFMIKSRR